VAALQQRSEPLFANEPLTGVSRRCAPLPTSEEVAPVVVAYLRQQGDTFIPRAIEALLPAEVEAPAPAPARARETVILLAFAVLLFVAAFAIAFAFLPRALD
jgi:hypothetical protein